MKKFIYKRRFFIVPPMIIAGVALIGYITMQLWNHLLPELFHLPLISFWQALGLLLLSKILFGFGGGGPGRRNRFNMSNEDREKFRAAWKERCNWGQRRPETL